MLHKHEAATGSVLAISFDQIGAGAGICKRLLGNTIWEMAYPKMDTSVPPDAPVTHQVRQLLVFSLEKLKSKMLEDQQCQSNAERQADAVLEKAVSSYKACRRRASAASGPYGA